MAERRRFWEIDFAKGMAIAMMVLFHFLWDLNYFGFIRVSLYSGFWGLFQKATAGLFILLVGVLLTLSYNRNRQGYAMRFAKRGAMVFGAGMLITLFTLIAFPEQFIYFGVLHFIGVSIIFSIPFVGKKWLSLAAGAIVFAVPLAFSLYSANIQPLMWLGFAVPRATLDFFPVFPWFSAMLAGIFLGNVLYKGGERKFEPEKMHLPRIGLLESMGKNSLLVYFLHQPVLFAAIYAVKLFF
ncbi:MAG: heparan-alpha-glucosaminide N-acetyltransferase [archaeon]